MKKVLIGSPINQKSEILKEFIESIKKLKKDNIEYSYIFIDDNVEEKSSDLLNSFMKTCEKVNIEKSEYASKNYICDEVTHRWSNELIEKVSKFKNYIIEKSIEGDYDYLFLVDSDLVLHEDTINRLISLNKDIVSTIFWTKWYPDSYEEPQVWLKDNYTLYDSSSNEGLSNEEAKKRKNEFLQRLKKPGTYEVGGLGACTLISKKALKEGVNFNRIYNISFQGEDRHFCIRAAVLGIQLYVDTYYPAYHIYRNEDLKELEKYKINNKERKLDIYREKAYKLVKEVIEGMGKYSYRENFSIDYLNCFEEEEKLKIINELNEKRAYIIKERIINFTKLTNYKIEFSDSIKEVLIRTVYINTGYINDYSYYKEMEGEFILKLQDGEYKIKKCNLIKEREPAILPLIRKAKEKDNKLTLSMIVKNEENRFLKDVLKSAREYIDNAVIIDDASTDNTVGIIKEVLKDVPYKIINNKESKFNNEIELRKQQWEETINTNPDWILFLDADEIFEDKFKDYIKVLMEDREVDGYLFRIYDFWNNEEYRDDEFWNAQNSYRLFLIRYQENFNYKFKERAQHCGRIPYNCMNLPYLATTLRLKHYGWCREEDRIKKYNRYMKLDPEGEFGNMEQYKSILDKNPNLVRWKE